MNTLEHAIARSRSHNEIVAVEVDDIQAGFRALLDALGTDCEYDYVDTRDQDGHPMREVWDASDTSGAGNMDWRVHLRTR